MAKSLQLTWRSGASWLAPDLQVSSKDLDEIIGYHFSKANIHR